MSGAGQRTVNMLVAALGGEGGGVLTNWLIEAAQRSGWYCQSTSLAGVAQRTGATIYYLEFMVREAGQPQPVMSLFPAQGDIDIAVTSEIAEAGRMLSRGFVSPAKTTLISSDHRVFGITEKSATADGTADTEMILTMAERYAQRFIHFDMAELVQRHGTVISAGLFGAVAGSGVLPFERTVFTDIVSAGKGASANLAAFEESFQRAASGGVAYFQPETPAGFSLPQPETPMGHRLLPRIGALPSATHEVVFHGVQRLVEYQDEQYAEEFLARVEQVNQRDAGEDDHGLTRETARWLALWMAFEDIPRVAQLKSRPGREAEIRAEVRAATGQPVQVTEFFHPRVEEVAALLPRSLGEWLLHSKMARGALQPFLGPRKLRTDKVMTGFTLRMLAGLRRMRRKTLGYAHEWQMIDRGFQAVCRTATQDHARAVADLGGMVKGYGATRHRTTTRLMAILDAVERGQADTAQRVRALQGAAMVGEDPKPLSELLASTAEAQAVH